MPPWFGSDPFRGWICCDSAVGFVVALSNKVRRAGRTMTSVKLGDPRTYRKHYLRKFRVRRVSERI
jgi:hypothetical protein